MLEVCVKCGNRPTTIRLTPPCILIFPAKRRRGLSSIRPFSCIEGLSTLSCPVLPYTKSASLTESPGNITLFTLNTHCQPLKRFHKSRFGFLTLAAAEV